MGFRWCWSFLLVLAGLADHIASQPSPRREPSARSASRDFDLVVRGATVIDGLGAPPRAADVGVSRGRIAAMGDLSKSAATRSIRAEGMVLAPGFIDVHTHAESITSRPEAHNFPSMGVTTIVSGNCGTSSLELDKVFARLEKTGISVNYASLVGHGSVRSAVLGRERRAPDAEELGRMRSLVRNAMRSGAFGMSTGLIYVPGTYAETDELVALSRVVAEFGGIYVSHMRNENDAVLDAIDEALHIGNQAHVPVHLSHLKANGRKNWGRAGEIVARLRAARRDGSQVTADQYAYDAASTSIDVLFPADDLSVGRKRFAERLATDRDFRTRMKEALFATMDRVGFGDLSYCRIAWAPGNTDLAGLLIPEAARRRLGKDDRDAQAEIALDLFEASKGARVSMIYHTMSERDVETLMKQPFIAVACDAGIRLRKTASKPHPRGAGNNPRVLARYVRERGVLELPEAVRKMTSLPAKTFGIVDRGEIRIGAWADLVLFDPDTVKDRATYSDPARPPEGMPHVFVNGVLVIEDGVHTGARPGTVLRHRAPRTRGSRR